MHKPLISIITVVYNSKKLLEQTIQSVINQTYKNIEYIIIDGGSTDGTIDVIKKYQSYLSFWSSEPDKGIFNAMNKGIDKATGNWLAFLNSGDYYYNSQVFDTIFSKELSDSDVIYGDMILKYSFGSFLSKPLELSVFHEQFPFSHPSSFIRSALAKRYKFNEIFRLAADYDIFYRLFLQEFHFKYIPIVISVFEAEHGASSSNNLKTYKDVSTINGTINNRNWKIHYSILILKNYIRKVIGSLSKTIYFKIMKKSICNRKNIFLINDENTILQ